MRRALDEADRPPKEWIDSYLPGFFAGPVDQASIDWLLEIMGDVRPAGIKAMVRAFAAADRGGVLGELSVPTLLLYGDADARSPRAIAEELHAGIPGSELVFLPGVGHVANIEAPERFNAEVRRFLRSVTDPG